jgi:predicted ATP-binding protein involved in virulence
MLDSVSFNNFRGLDNVTVPLTQFTMLTGSNGIGKTSVLEGLYCLFSQTKLDVSPLTRYKKTSPNANTIKQSYDYKLFWDECPNYGSKQCSVEATKDDSVWSWEYSKAQFTDLGAFVNNSTIAIDFTTEFSKFVWHYTGGESCTLRDQLIRFQVIDPNGGLYLLPGFLNHHDKNFLSMCSYIDFPLTLEQPEFLPYEMSKFLIKALQIINPHVTDIRKSGVIDGISVVLDNEKELSLSALGNGAALWVGVLSAIYNIVKQLPQDEPVSDIPIIILIDEIGSGVHYSIMLAMWKFIKDFMSSFKYIQFVFTSHSDDCIRAYCEAFKESDQASIVRMYKTFHGNKIITTEYTKEDFPNIVDGEWEVRG